MKDRFATTKSISFYDYAKKNLKSFKKKYDILNLLFGFLMNGGDLINSIVRNDKIMNVIVEETRIRHLEQNEVNTITLNFKGGYLYLS